VSGTDALRLLHVVAAFGFVTGLIGRDILLGQARKSNDVARIRHLVESAGPFERVLVRPGSLAVLVFGILTWWAEDLPLWGVSARWLPTSLIVFASAIPLIPLVFIPRGRVFEAALASADSVTPELSAALRDPWVAFARWYELGVLGIVVLLMVTKPF
jgi:hypothetical protein